MAIATRPGELADPFSAYERERGYHVEAHSVQDQLCPHLVLRLALASCRPGRTTQPQWCPFVTTDANKLNFIDANQLNLFWGKSEDESSLPGDFFDTKNLVDDTDAKDLVDERRISINPRIIITDDWSSRPNEGINYKEDIDKFGYIKGCTDQYKIVYERKIEEEDILKMQEEADLRAKGIAALQRFCSVDYEYGTWL